MGGGKDAPGRGGPTRTAHRGNETSGGESKILGGKQTQRTMGERKFLDWCQKSA